MRENRASRVRWIVTLKGGVWWAVDTWNLRRVKFGESEAARQHAVRMNAAE